MNLPDLFDKVESVDFAAGIGILSGFKVLLLILSKDETLQALIADLRQSPEHTQTVYGRIVELLPANDQPEYAHPSDAALAGYLYALAQTDPELTADAIEQILQTPKLWWSLRLAQHLQENIERA